ncbi:MAG: hypothetical protein AB7E31_16315 [Desulfitobacterium sp.]
MIKISDYVRVIKPKYIFLKLTPNNSIRNNTTQNIAKSIASLYKNAIRYIKAEESKLIRLFGKEFVFGTKYAIEPRPKVSYFIYIERKRIEFYFIIPEFCISIVKERLSESWQKVTISEVKEIPHFSETATKYQMVYTKEDGLSLKADNRTNELLESNLNIVDVLEDGDKMGLFYNFIPISQHSWFNEYKSTINKVRMNQPVDKNKAGVGYILKFVFSMVHDLTNDVAAFISGKPERNLVKYDRNATALEQTLMNIMNPRMVSEATLDKGRDTILNTQILVLSESESENRIRQINNAKSLSQSFNSIAGDNFLSAKSYTKKFDPLSYSLGSTTNKMGTKETSNLIALPGRELLERYKCIEKVQTQETEVPEELKSGVMCIGESTCKGNATKSFLSTDFNYKYLSLVIMGPNRSGKSKLLANLARDAISNGECVIIPDFISTCQLSAEIASVFPPDKVLTITCDQYDTLQGMGYNEVPKSKDSFMQYKNAKEQTSLLMTLVDSINLDNASFTARMGRYFESAALVVFLANGPIKDVFAVLMNHKTRKQYIDRITDEQLENMDEYIEYLNELDETDKKGQVVGTRGHLITGAIDRLQRLKVNAYIETMLKKESTGNIDLVEEFQKNQLIVIKMPQRMFLTDNEKDVYVTYWMTKIWLALQIRDEMLNSDRSKMVKVNLIIDELYQVNNAEKFLKEKLSQLPKFNIKPVISCHYLNQLKVIREEFRSANASYMLIAGCDKQNYSELKSELYPYEEEDLLNLKRYHSLNLIKCNDGYSTFITHLPAPIS